MDNTVEFLRAVGFGPGGRMPTWAKGLKADTNGNIAERCTAAIELIFERLANFYAEIEAIDASNYSQKGLAEQKKAIAAKHQSSLSELENGFLQTLAGDVDDLQRKAMADGDSLSEGDKAMVAAIWNWLPNDPLELMLLHQRALSADDRLSALAIEQLGTFHPARASSNGLNIDELRRNRILSKSECAGEAGFVNTAHADVKAVHNLFRDELSPPKPAAIRINGKPIDLSESAVE